MSHCKLSLLTAVLCTAGAAAPAFAAGVIIAPGTIISNTMGMLSSPGFADTNMINQVGLNTPYVSGVTDPAVYLSGSPTHANTFSGNVHWLSNSIPTGIITFDLGADYTLNGALYVSLNYSGHGARQVQDVRFEISTDAAFTSPVLMHDGTFLAQPNSLPSPVRSLPFSNPATGRYVRFYVDSNYGNPTLSHLGELAFTTVPEPSTALLGGGALLGLMRRRRLRLVTSAL